MKRLAFGALAVGLLLGGCNSKNEYYDAPKALDKMSPEEVCSFYGHYRENPELSQHSKDVVTGQMRAKACPNA